KFLDEISEEACEIGAVNVIVNRGGKLIGHNTDCFGAMEALRTGIKKQESRVMQQPPGRKVVVRGGAQQTAAGSKEMHRRWLLNKRAVVLGAGGAARAVIYGLKRAGARVLILNRTLAHAKKLAKDFGCRFGNLQDFDPAKCDILINTTSVGMWPKTSQTPLPYLTELYPKNKLPRPLVMDIIYRPRITKLLCDAKRAGCQIIIGDKMFLGQAAKSFDLWTGRKPGFMKL
ncbi:MAG: shikimate dehydrogenase, partial [Patescibacteria group bacterium]